jgi:hypothetical protein
MRGFAWSNDIAGRGQRVIYSLDELREGNSPRGWAVESAPSGHLVCVR